MFFQTWIYIGRVHDKRLGFNGFSMLVLDSVQIEDWFPHFVPILKLHVLHTQQSITAKEIMQLYERTQTLKKEKQNTI